VIRYDDIATAFSNALSKISEHVNPMLAVEQTENDPTMPASVKLRQALSERLAVRGPRESRQRSTVVAARAARLAAMLCSTSNRHA
jgi:hypothetical protein